MKKSDILINLEKEFLHISAKYHFNTEDHNRIFDKLNIIIDNYYNENYFSEKDMLLAFEKGKNDYPDEKFKEEIKTIPRYIN